MRIIWNEDEKKFQAELTPGDFWREEMELVKSVGFKTSGPPAWTWCTPKASVLNKLRDNKPKSGLFLTEVALEKYKSFSEKEEKNEAVKKAFLEAKKAAKKVSLDPSIKYEGMVELVIPEKGYIGAEDLPPMPPWVNPRKEILTPCSGICMICESPVYFYEKDTICLWCEKELDNLPAV
jgi:hypothetical protein